MRRRGLMLGAMVLFVSGLAGNVAEADVIHLTTGRFLEGLIVKETTAEVTVQVAHEGYLFLDHASIRAIERSDEEARQRLLAQWRQEATEARRREEERQAFETAQRERGLVKYQGEWITAQELSLIKDHQDEEIRQQHEEEVRRTAQALRALEEERYRVEELVSRQRLVEEQLARTSQTVQQLQAENCRLRDLVQQQIVLIQQVGGTLAVSDLGGMHRHSNLRNHDSAD